MTGKPGKSGGPRKGAGRPPKSMTLRDGQQVITRHEGMMVSGVVKVIRRGMIVIQLEDHSTIKIAA